MSAETLLKEETKTTDKQIPIKVQIEEFLSIITSFSSLLEQETKALKEARFQAVRELHENKKFHAKRYEEKVRNLTARRDELLDLDLETRERLLQERYNFNQLLERNKRALLSAKTSAQRLEETLLGAMRKSILDEKKTNYSAEGQPQTYNSATSSYSFNETL